jgi:hypothetical protein
MNDAMYESRKFVLQNAREINGMSEMKKYLSLKRFGPSSLRININRSSQYSLPVECWSPKETKVTPPLPEITKRGH